MLRMKNEGGTYKQIGEKFSIPKSTAHDALMRYWENKNKPKKEGKMKFRSLQEKEDLVKQVDSLRSEGQSLDKAAKITGIAPSLYYGWKKLINGSEKKPSKKTKPYVRELTPLKYSESPEAVTNTSGKMICVIGDVNTIQSFIRSL